MTGLRFLLAMWVILHHLVSRGMMLDTWAQSLPGVVRIFCEQGHVAVRTFFALSGFVLAQGYARTRWNRRDLVSYGVARFARVYPVYLVSLVVIGWFIFNFLLLPEVATGRKIETVAVYGLVLHGWVQDPGAGWNTPAWSLSCEFLFYLCLPPLLLWLGQRSRVKLAVLIATALLLPIVLHRAGVPQSWKPIMHLGDFLVGIVTARIYSLMKSSGGWARRGAWFYLSATVAAVVVIIFPDVLAGVADLGTVLRPLNGLLVLGLALGGGFFARFLSNAFLQYLGQASYSLYILHVPVLWWFGNHGPIPLRYLHASVAWIYLPLIILLSCACFQWIEKPANQSIRSWGRRL